MESSGTATRGSNEPSDIDVLSSRTASPPVLEAEEISFQPMAYRCRNCCSCGIFNPCKEWCNSKVCNKNIKWAVIFCMLAFICMLLTFVSKTKTIFWELFCICLLVMYCSLFSIVVPRGSLSKSFWRAGKKKRPVDDGPSNKDQRREEDVSAANQTDVPAAESQTDVPAAGSRVAVSELVLVEVDLHAVPEFSETEDQDCGQTQ